MTRVTACVCFSVVLIDEIYQRVAIRALQPWMGEGMGGDSPTYQERFAHLHLRD